MCGSEAGCEGPGRRFQHKRGIITRALLSEAASLPRQQQRAQDPRQRRPSSSEAVEPVAFRGPFPSAPEVAILGEGCRGSCARWL